MLTIWRASTGRGRGCLVLGVLLLVAGASWRYPVVAGLGACLVTLVLAELAAVLGSRPVRVRREVTPLVVLRHDPCQGALEVLGRRRRGLVRLDVAERVGSTLVPVSLPDHGADHAGDDHAPGHRADLGDPSEGPVGVAVYDIATPRRGLIGVGPVQVRLVGLTGMAARSTESGSLDEVRVLPRRIPVAAMMPGHRRAASGGDDSLEIGGTDLVGLHEYGMGDDLRRLHWATSARTGTLMVREDAEPSEPHVCVLLDDRTTAYRGDVDLFEEAVELAAALTRTASEAGHPVRLHTVTGRAEVAVPGSPTRLPRREQRDLDWLFAEIELSDAPEQIRLPERDLDVAVAVTGPGSDLQVLGLVLGSAATRVLAVVDPAPTVSALQHRGLLTLRGRSSEALAALWDEAAQT